MKKPQLSVILPVFNAEQFLASAIESVLSQSFTDFELIVINDGSTDKSEKIIHSFSDPRIVYIRNDSNLKLIRTLNKGLELAQGDYIARMDADDICHPERFLLQIDYLKKNSHVSLVGANFYLIDSKDRILKAPEKLPEDPSEVRWRMLRGSCLYHPLVMGKASVLKNNPYQTEFMHAEDYELWLRIMKSHQIANLPQRLLYYRIHDKSVSQTHQTTQNQIATRALSLYANSIYDLHLKNEFWTSLQFLRLRADLISLDEFIASFTELRKQFFKRESMTPHRFIYLDMFTVISKLLAFSKNPSDRIKAFFLLVAHGARHPMIFLFWLAKTTGFIAEVIRYKAISTKVTDTV